MKPLKLLLFITLFSITKASFAYQPEEGNVTATMGPFVHKTDFDGSRSGAEAPYLGGIGLIANGDINKKGALEIAIFHMNKAFFRDQDGKHIAEQTELIHIAMGYRRWLTSYFSASLAFFSSYTMGQVKSVHNDFSSGQEIPTSARDNTEYGFDLSMQTDLWSNEKFAVVLDGRYSFSVTKKPSEHSDHYGALIGLRYLIQEKRPN